MTERITVIGTGTWGITLATMLAQRYPTILWCRTEDEAALLARDREHKERLPGRPFPEGLVLSASLDYSLSRCTVLLLVVPANTMRSNIHLVEPFLAPETVLLSGTKGLEVSSCRRMSEVIAEEVPGASSRTVVLSGPNLAREIAAGLPAAAVLATPVTALASRLRAIFMTPDFRVYTNSDQVGVELAGALKNIIALGAGFCDGLELGDNAKAAFIGRGLAEITRLGLAAGARPATFAGLAGLGDIIATCASPQSRNRWVGEQLARGRTLPDVEASLHMVAEGVSTTRAALRLARTYGIEMPIVELTHAVLFEHKDPRQALTELMTRDPKDELAGIIESREDHLI